MKRLALCIGNNEYTFLSQLNCAVSDASAISEALKRLGFEVKMRSDLDRENLINEVINFCDRLPEYDMGVFYYAGHGFQCDSDNILAPVDLNIEKRPSEVRMDSFPLSELMQQMGKSVNTTKIVILDACRESLGYRGAFRDFSPMVAPQGSIIAFSTSPGQTARENSKTGHGRYTETLLDYIELPRVPIETVFKKVREQLSAQTGGGQIPWEHTSLIGDVYLNPDTIYSGISYGDDAFADGDFKFRSDSQIKECVELLKTHTWAEQERGLDRIRGVDFSLCGPSELFVLGRNITQAAEGNCFAAQRFIDDFTLKRYIPVEAQQHMLNGMSYEIYFDSGSKIRNNYKSNRLKKILSLLESDEYFSCREFISKMLMRIIDRPIYIPGQNEAIDIIVETDDSFETTDEYETIRIIKGIKIKGQSFFLCDVTAADPAA